MKIYLLILFYCFNFSFLVSSSFEKDLTNKIVSNNPPKWMINQISSDLQSISRSDLSSEALNATMTNSSIGELYCIRYQITNGNLSIHSKTQGISLSGGIEVFTKILSHLAKIIPHITCDFIVSFHDTSAHSYLMKAPFFCFSKNRFNKIQSILMPDVLCLTNSDDLINMAKEGSKKYSWTKKKNMAFWRGASTGGLFTLENYLQFPRFQLVDMSHRFPSFIDAKFTDLVQGAENFQEHITYYIGGRVGIPEHMLYKYQILVDGNSCAWNRAYWQLFSNSIILKQNSDEIQWYYGGLKPYVHYIPVKSNFSDLVKVVQWAKENDREVKKISKNAQEFANANLKKIDLYYYIYLLLNEYAKIQNQTTNDLY